MVGRRWEVGIAHRRREALQCGADHARVSRVSDELSNRPIRSDLAFRDQADDVVHRLVKVFAKRLLLVFAVFFWFDVPGLL